MRAKRSGLGTTVGLLLGSVLIVGSCASPQSGATSKPSTRPKSTCTVVELSGALGRDSGPGLCATEAIYAGLRSAGYFVIVDDDSPLAVEMEIARDFLVRVEAKTEADGKGLRVSTALKKGEGDILKLSRGELDVATFSATSATPRGRDVRAAAAILVSKVSDSIEANRKPRPCPDGYFDGLLSRREPEVSVRCQE